RRENVTKRGARVLADHDPPARRRQPGHQEVGRLGDEGIAVHDHRRWRWRWRWRWRRWSASGDARDRERGHHDGDTEQTHRRRRIPARPGLRTQAASHRPITVAPSSIRHALVSPDASAWRIEEVATVMGR